VNFTYFKSKRRIDKFASCSKIEMFLTHYQTLLLLNNSSVILKHPVNILGNTVKRQHASTKRSRAETIIWQIIVAWQRIYSVHSSQGNKYSYKNCNSRINRYCQFVMQQLLKDPVNKSAVAHTHPT